MTDEWAKLKMPGKDPGQVAYEGYVGQSEGVSMVSGAQLPPWDAQADEVKACWRAAAVAVVADLTARIHEAREGSSGPAGHGGRPGMEPIMADAKDKDREETEHQPDGTILPEEREVAPEDHGHEGLDDETAAVGREPRTGILPARDDDPIANTPGPADQERSE